MIWRAGAAVTLLAAALLFARLEAPERSAETLASAPPAQPVPALPATRSAAAPTQPAATLLSDWPLAELTDTAEAAATPAALDTVAIASLRATRDGDPRAPAIGEAQPHERPNAHTLADPGRYQDWQASRREANYADYLHASQARLVEIDAHLAWGRQNGVSEAQLKAGQEKRDRLAAVREQLATDYPHLAEQVASETQAAADAAAN